MESKREKYFLYNNLSILLKAVEKQRTTVDLRNESSIFGTVEQTDAYMNVLMTDCVFTDPRGDSFKYDMFFVQARNISCVHIPTNIRIIPAINKQLRQLSNRSQEVKDTKLTFKAKRAQQRQEEGMIAVEKILESRNKTETCSTREESK